MKVGDIAIDLRVDPDLLKTLEETFEIITDRVIALDHARICAGLVWPYQRMERTIWLDKAKMVVKRND